MTTQPTTAERQARHLRRHMKRCALNVLIAIRTGQADDARYWTGAFEDYKAAAGSDLTLLEAAK